MLFLDCMVNSTDLLLSLDVEIHHLETAKQLEFTNVSVVAQGPLRGSVRAEVKYGKSLVTVTVSFAMGQFVLV